MRNVFRQVVSIIAASFVLMALFALGPFLEPLPEACLGSIIMVALINMMKQVSEVSRLWSISFIDTVRTFGCILKPENFHSCGVVIADGDYGENRANFNLGHWTGNY